MRPEVTILPQGQVDKTASPSRSALGDLRDRVRDQAIATTQSLSSLPPEYREAIDLAASRTSGAGAAAGMPLGPQPVGEPLWVTPKLKSPGWIERYMTAPFGRGIDRFQALASLAIGDTEEFSDQQRQILESTQLTAEDQDIMRQISETDSLWEALKLYGTNPRLIAAISSESLGLFAPTLGAAAVTGPLGGVGAAAATVGIGSGATEYLATIEQAAAERGVDPTDAQQMDALLKDDQFMAEARERGIQRAIPIAAMDALSVGLAGKLFRTTAGAGRLARSAAATGELAAQGGYGGTGEALAQLAERGSVYAPGEVAGEIVGELGTGPAEIAIAAMSRTQKPPTAPPSIEETPPAATPPTAAPPAPTQPSGTDPVAALRRRQNFQDSISPQQPLPLDYEGPYASPVPAAEEKPVSDIQQRFRRGISGQQELDLGVPGEVTVSPETGTMPAEQQATEVAEVEAEPQPGDMVQKWMDSQERAEDGKRQKKLYVTDTKTKVTPANLLKKDLLAIGAAIKKQHKDTKLPALSTAVQMPAKIEAYFNGLVAALENADRQKLADTLRTAMRDPDPWVTHEALTAIEGFVLGTQDAVAGTQYESVKNQYRRGRVEADKVYQQGVKLPKVYQRVDAVRNMLSATRRLFEHLAGVTIGKNNVDESGEILSAEAVAKRLKNQPKYLQDAGAALADLNGQLYGSGDATAAAARRVYKALDKIGQALEKRGGKKIDERAARIEAVGVDKIQSEQTAVVPVEQTVPAPKEVKKSENVPESRIEKLAQDRAIQEERVAEREMKSQSSAIRNEVNKEEDLRAGKKHPKEVTKATKWKKVRHGKTRRKVQTRLGTSQNLSTAEGRAAEEEKVKNLPPKRENVQTQNFVKREKTEDTRVTVSPKRAYTTRNILRNLRLQNKKYAKGLISDLSFFRDIVNEGTGALSYAGRKDTDAAWVSGLRDALPSAIRKEFDALIDRFVNLPVQEGGHPKFEEKIRTFIKENVANAEGRVLTSAINYARTLRTLQQRGFEQGTIVLESPVAQSQYNKVLEARAATFLTAIRPRLNDSMFGEVRVGSLQELLNQWRSSLDNEAWDSAILDKLIATGIDIPVYAVTNLRNPNTDAPIVGLYEQGAGRRAITLDSDRPEGGILKTLLHEAAHAATINSYLNSPRYAQLVNNIFNRAKSAAEKRGLNLHGVTDPREFLAEVYSNKSFQEFLKTVSVEDRSLWQRIVDAVRSMLGLDEQYTSALDAILSVGVLDTEQGIRAGNYAIADAVASDVETVVAESKQKAAVGWENLTQALQKGNLGFMDLNVMGRKYRSMVQDAAEKLGIENNPLEDIINAVVRTSRQARVLAQKFQELAEKAGKLSAADKLALGKAMELVTRAKLDPLKPVNAVNQPWLFDKQGQNLEKAELVRRAETAFNALNEDTKEVFLDMRKLVQEARDTRRQALLKHALQMRVPGIEEGDLELLSTAPTLEDFQASVADNDMYAHGDLIKPDTLNGIADIIFGAGEIPGTYFPLKRHGKWVTKIEADSIEDAYFAMHETRAEAEADAARLTAEGKEGVEVAPRVRGQEEPGTLKAVRALVSKLDASDSQSEKISAQLQAAMAEILSDRILYSQQLKRQGIEGTKPEDMLKNVEDYVRASISTASTMDSAYEYDQGLRQLAQIQNSPDVDADVQDTIRNVRDELLIRAAEVASDREVLFTDRILGSIGFYTYLGAPSYWILNSTQTAVVGVPVLAGIAGKGYIQAANAMKRAYGQLYKAAEGRKALTEDLEATKSRLTTEQAEIITRLEEDNVIQSTIAHEFNVLTNPGTSTYGKVISVLTAVPEAIERFNRISMALAAMDLGVADYTQIKDIVEASQFNYDPANRARLLKYAPEFLGGGARRFIAPMMMFKVFGVNMARLVYGNVFDLIFKKNMTPEERATARKIVVGIVGSHTLAGGAFGGLGLGAAQIVGATINAMLDDDDQIDWAKALDEFVAEHTNDYVARVVTRGVPAAVGVDMSASVNLGNLLFMNRDNDWSEYGGVEQSVYALLGPVAQYFSGSAREFSKFVDGESSVADVLEKSVPLKLYRALSQSYRYGMEGLETRQGQQFLDPEDLNAGNLVTTALGLRPAVVSQRQDRFYAARTLNRTLENGKSELMRKAATANTAAERQKAWREIREWNAGQRKRRNFSLIISPSSVRRSRSAQQETSRRYRQERYTEYN